MSSAKLGDVPIKDFKEKVASSLIKMASQGSVPAATAVLKLFSEIEDAHEAERHDRLMAEYADDTIGMSRYLGTLGVDKTEVAKRFKRAMGMQEIEAWKEGVKNRQIKIRALELAALEKGEKLQVAKWMKEG